MIPGTIIYRYKLDEPGTIDVTRQSRATGKIHTRTVKATPEQMDAWMKGALAQDAFPDASLDDREFIISGITPEEWNSVFGEPKE